MATDPISYVMMKYNSFSNDNSVNKKDFKEAFWTGISLRPEDSVKHRCLKCKEDTRLFIEKRYIGIGDLDIPLRSEDFERLYYKNYKELQCTPHCFWYDWFREIRRKM